MASAGVGTASHLAGELFQMQTGTALEHIVYRGGDGAYAALVGGSVDVYFPPLISASDHIKRGALRALPGAAAPGCEANTWFGIGAPRDTPVPIVNRLNRAINAALAEGALAARLGDVGGTVIAGSPADFRALVARETERWAKVIKASGTTLS
jgi:tripartite-type tricarboxylate transporter receptor subunit TctC